MKTKTFLCGLFTVIFILAFISCGEDAVTGGVVNCNVCSVEFDSDVTGVFLPADENSEDAENICLCNKCATDILGAEYSKMNNNERLTKIKKYFLDYPYYSCIGKWTNSSGGILITKEDISILYPNGEMMYKVRIDSSEKRTNDGDNSSIYPSGFRFLCKVTETTAEDLFPVNSDATFTFFMHTDKKSIYRSVTSSVFTKAN